MKTEQEDLKKSEERYRALFENAADAIFIATSEGIFTEVNASGARLLGFEPGELIGKAIADILRPEEINRFLIVRESMLEGNTRLDEWMLVRKDGTSFVAEISANMLPDKCFQAFVRDITERRRLQELSRRLTRHAMLRADVHAVISGSEKHLPSVLQSNMESVVQHLDAAFARVWLIDEKTNVLELQASAGIYTRIDGTYSRFAVGRHKIGEIAARKTSYCSNTILDVPQIDQEWATREGMRSFAGFPLIVNDRVIGVTAMFSRREMSGDVLEAFESIAAVIAQGVERRRAEEQLLLMKYTIDHVADSAAIIGSDARFVFANDACCKSLGYAREELLRLTVHDIDPNFPVEVWAEHYENLRTQKVLTFESNHKRKDGYVFPVELSLNFLEYNGQEYNFAFGRDITERKRAEEELREKQQLLQTIFDNSTMSIYVKDLEGRALLVNRVFEEILGLPNEEIIGKTEIELWRASPALQENSRQSVEDCRDQDIEVFKIGAPVQREEIFKVGDREHAFLTIKCPIYDEAGAPYAICGISTDITQRRRAEKETRRLQTELEHVARVMTMGALASSIAHEVNQPLAGIVTNGSACLRWLAMEPPDLEEAGNAVHRIIRDGNRAGEVISRTRAILKKTPPRKFALDINEIVRETITLAQSEIQKNKILLQANFSAALPRVAGDKIQMQQVLLNLLMNGIDAIKEAPESGARLAVETRVYEENKILVAVEDSGVGSDRAGLDKIFEAFYTTKADGMGMGLSISRSIIEAHGGQLWASANDGAGMTFRFTLPVGTGE